MKETVKQLANSRIRIIDSLKPGPTLVIFCGVHGDERCGIDATNSFDFKPEKGKIIVVTANLAAIKVNKRFVEKNLNRMFCKPFDTSIESRTARELMSILDSCDALLDIHASTTPKSEPFVICGRQSLALAKCMPGKNILLDIDKVHPGSTDWYVNQRNKIAICVECGYLDDAKSTKIAVMAMERYLAYFEVQRFAANESNAKAVFEVQRIYKPLSTFTAIKNISDFEFFDAQTIVGYAGKCIVTVKNECVLFLRDCEANDEAFITATKI